MTSSFQKDLSTIIQEQVTASYVMFAVDDLVVIRSCDMHDCVKALHEEQHYAFYLRMGKNIRRHYGMQPGSTMHIPALTAMNLAMPSGKSVFFWDLVSEKVDFFNPWYYPFSLDMTIFKKALVKDLLVRWLQYSNPGFLEYRWARAVRLLPGQKGLCFDESIVVNIPLNIVDNTREKNMNHLSTRELLALFNQGLKIDIKKLAGIDHSSPHEDIVPSFIPRAV